MKEKMLETSGGNVLMIARTREITLLRNCWWYKKEYSTTRLDIATIYTIIIADNKNLVKITNTFFFAIKIFASSIFS